MPGPTIAVLSDGGPALARGSRATSNLFGFERRRERG